MLQLQTKIFDICRISKLLVRYNIKASISNQVITLDGEVSDELLDELCKNVTICNVQNFKEEVLLPIEKETNYPESDETVLASTKAEDIATKTDTEVATSQTVMEKYDLLYPTIKRGEVYRCDFGEPYGSEQGYERYAIVVQNDEGNLNSPTTIVLPCTTEYKMRIPAHHHFVFSKKNMIDYNVVRVGLKQNVVMAEQIRTVDKTRLRKFLGTMTPEFMDKIQEIIDVSLDLKRQEKVIPKNEQVNPNAPKERKDLNIAQIQLLALVDINELFKIAQARDSDNIKAEKIIELFGFDMQKNGVQYLLKAILVSPKDAYFNLETLCDGVAKSEHDVSKDEIKRLIVARIKEQLGLKKAPTIDFIRLVNSFLVKEEDKQYEEGNI